MAQLKDLLVNGKSRFIDKIYASDQFISKVVQGTSPFLVDSDTLVTNLNADLLDGYHYSAFSLSTHTHTWVGDNTMKIYPQYNNELNFGGSNNSSTIYMGYRATDSKPIPTSFVFGGSSGTATVKAKQFYGDLSTNYLVPIKTKTYSNYTCAAADTNSGYIFFANVIPTNTSIWEKPWRVHYTLQVDTSVNACQGFYDIYIGYSGSTVNYHIFNRFYSTSYRPLYYHTAAYHNTSAKFSSYATTNPVKLGVRVTSAYGANTVARTYTIKVWEEYGCTVSFPNAIETYGNVYSTTYYALSELPAYSQGLAESWDDNDTTTLQMYYSRLKAGTNGIKQYSLVMMDASGNWQSLTMEAGVGPTHTKNPIGFVLGSPVYYMNSGSNYTSGQYPGYGTLRAYTGLVDFRYSFPGITANGAGLTSYLPVYIVGTIGGDGLFYLDDNWLAQSIPASENGKVYIKVTDSVYPDYGENSKNYRGDLVSRGYAYCYKEGKIQRYVKATDLGHGGWCSGTGNYWGKVAEYKYTGSSTVDVTASFLITIYGTTVAASGNILAIRCRGNSKSDTKNISANYVVKTGNYDVKVTHMYDSNTGAYYIRIYTYSSGWGNSLGIRLLDSHAWADNTADCWTMYDSIYSGNSVETFSSVPTVTGEEEVPIGVSTILNSLSSSHKVMTVSTSTNASHYLTFVDSNNSPAAEESLYTSDKIAFNPSTGNLGIGTTSPSTKLEVKGDILINNDFTNEHGIFFRSGFTSSNKYNVSILAYDHSGTTNTPDGISINGQDGISFCTGGNTRNEVVRITGASSPGKVGIGTTSPSEKLHVVGNARFDASATSGVWVYGGSYYIQLRPESSSWASLYTNSTQWYFNKPIQVAGDVIPYTTNTYTLGNSSKVWKNIYATQGTFKAAQGTAPLVVDSSTQISKLNVDYLDNFHGMSAGSLLYTYHVDSSLAADSITDNYWYATITFARSYIAELTKTLITASYSNVQGQLYLNTFTYNGAYYAFTTDYNGCNIKGIARKSQNNPIYYLKLAKPTTYSGTVPPGNVHVYSSYNCTITVSATAPSGVTFTNVTAGKFINLNEVNDLPSHTHYIGTTATQNTSTAGQDLTGIGTVYIKGNGNSWTEGIRIKPNGSWATILLGGTDLTADTGTSAKSWSIHNYDGSFYIAKNGSGATGTNTALLQNVSNNWNFAKGNVGIGTAPSTALHVKSDSNTSAATQVSIENATFTQTTYCRAVDATAAAMVKDSRMVYMIGKAGTNSNKAYFGYHHIADACTNNFATIGLHSHDELLNVLASGNVGIGTTAPSQKLHVSGGLVNITNQSNTLTIGSQNSSWTHFSNSVTRPFYFSDAAAFNGNVYPYTTATRTLGQTSNRWTTVYVSSGIDSSGALGLTAAASKAINFIQGTTTTASFTTTGVLSLKANVYTDTSKDGALNLNNSNIYGVNSVIFADLCDNAAEGIQFYRDATHADSVHAKDGVLYFTPNRSYGSAGTSYKIWHENNDGSGSGLDADTVDGKHADDFLFKLRRLNEVFEHSTYVTGMFPPAIFELKNAGYPVYTDPEFASGQNSVSVYNNSGGGTVTITREQAGDHTNSSGYQLKIVTNGTASPGTGGFVQTITSRANAVFVQIFRAKVPVGYNVTTASNSMGTSYQDKFITNRAGTGKWEWYARVVYCGASGSFATGGYVYLSANSGYSATSVTWYLSYCNLIDITKLNYDGLRTRYADSATDATYMPLITSSTANYADSAMGKKMAFNVYALTGSAPTPVSGTGPSTGDGFFMVFNYNDAYVTQIAVDLDPTYKLSVRHWKNDASTWRPWRDILTTANYTSYLGYIGTTAVQASSAAQAVTGITALTFNGATSAGTNYITGTAGRIYFGGNFHLDSLGSNATYINYYTGNNVYLVAGSTQGKVGIGTSSPSEKLHVAGNTYISGTLETPGPVRITSTSGEKNILIGNQDSNGANKPAIIKSANAALYFGTGTSWSGTGGTMTTTLFLSGDNKVGIGTTSPENKLDVNGIASIYPRGNDNTTFRGSLIIKQQNSVEGSGDTWDESKPSFGIQFNRFWTSGTSPYGETACAGIFALVTSSWRGGLVFRTKNNTTNGGTHDISALILKPSGAAQFASTVTASRFISTVATGTQPYSCTSTTLNTNLNADLLDGEHAAAFARKIVAGTTVAMANSGGTITVEANKIIPVTTTGTSAVTFNFTWNSPAACDEAHVIITGSGSSKTITIGNVNSDSTNTKKNNTAIKVTSGGYGEISILYFDSKYFIRAVGN